MRRWAVDLLIAVIGAVSAVVVALIERGQRRHEERDDEVS